MSSNKLMKKGMKDLMKKGGINKILGKSGNRKGVLDIPVGPVEGEMNKKAAGGMMNKKGYAMGGAMKKKGYAMGGKMMKKGYKKGGKVRGAGIASKGVRSAKMVTMKGS